MAEPALQTQGEKSVSGGNLKENEKPDEDLNYTKVKITAPVDGANSSSASNGTQVSDNFNHSDNIISEAGGEREKMQ